jgi:hypothetical protein
MVIIAQAVLLMAASFAHAEIPNQSKEELKASASHALIGTIQRTYERAEKRGDFEYTYGVAEVAVERVDKGDDIGPNDRVFVRYWHKRWMREGNPPPDHYGHRNVPEKTDSAEIYVKGNRSTGFDVLSPNGFFKVTKAKTSEARPLP